MDAWFRLVLHRIRFILNPAGGQSRISLKRRRYDESAKDGNYSSMITFGNLFIHVAELECLLKQLIQFLKIKLLDSCGWEVSTIVCLESLRKSVLISGGQIRQRTDMAGYEKTARFRQGIRCRPKFRHMCEASNDQLDCCTGQKQAKKYCIKTSFYCRSLAMINTLWHLSSTRSRWGP